MKILVVSDSHGRLDYLIEIFESETPDVVIFAGDHSRDGIELSYVKSGVDYYIVKGNTDSYDYETEENLEFSLEDKRIFLTHGHLFGVKGSYNKIAEYGITKGIDIVIFGHTHRRYLGELKGVKFFNPGAVVSGEYGVLEIKNGRVEFFHKRLEI